MVEVLATVNDRRTSVHLIVEVTRQTTDAWLTDVCCLVTLKATEEAHRRGWRNARGVHHHRPRRTGAADQLANGHPADARLPDRAHGHRSGSARGRAGVAATTIRRRAGT